MIYLIALATAAPTTAGSTQPAVQAPPPLDPIQPIWEDPASAQIINGEPAERGDWPMAGAMILTGTLTVPQMGTLEQTALLCSSSLIAPDVVLLAAHCIDLDALGQQLGQAELNNVEFYWSRKPDLTDYQLGMPAANLPRDAIRAIDSVKHEDFDINGIQIGLANNKDIALLFLEEPVLDIPLAYLPVADTDETGMEIGEDLVVVGWGQQIATQQGQQPPPNSYGIKYMGISSVAEKRPFEFKVGEKTSDVRKCHGDSGGPSYKKVTTDSSEIYRQVGITSHSYDLTDCFVTGGVDTRVSHYLDWIDEQLSSRCEDGTRSWCEIPGIIPPPLTDGTVAWEVVEEEERACGCSSNTGTSWWFFAGLLGLLPRMRRR